ncbi:hypothetical protein NIES2119_08105 [[Phormidium ambiguum] IAM M-71]|uniref:F5/8 type C domain-containing protein n=1 Tax=[Phormidium ambiguum] IAM M-71 TaxID=454136 RepID=A0A1U7IP76_9CYAN|nr:discoidin domain-containing protein [Phormidium ambiguum]OKH39083.1 hypothetical protein NIES2119_08105 [Phormidium ambiguum IAM M-71]
MPFKSIESNEHEHLNLSVLANFLEVNGELFYKNYKIISNTEYLNILANQLSAGDWGGSNPSSIFEIVDGDDNTYSAWANGFGSGNKGWIKADLGSIYIGTLEIKSDVALNASWGTNTIRYYIETSTDGITYSLIYSKDVIMTTNGEVQTDTKPFNARYIRWGLLDIGNGAGKMKTAYLKVSV